MAPALAAALAQAVPAHMVALSADTEARRRLLADLTPEAFAALARVLAAAALEPGGVTLLGEHWCAQAGCRETCATG